MTENKIKPTIEQVIYCLKAESARYPEVCKEYQVLMKGTPQDNEYNFCPKCGQALEEEKSN